MSKREYHPLDSIAANSAWVDALLDLFWAVDEEMKSGRNVNPTIVKSYEEAEKARQRL